ncbi:MAG TPA: diacylglycerol kinase family protein [Chloroflexota bacterium]|nr:diacylglycerol kinase family protein [Chloroflexota bacterium]
MTASPPRAVIREVPRRPAPAQRSTLWAQERRSFGYAFQGIGHAWRTQRHLRIHVALGLMAAGAAMVLGIAAAEWAALLGVITLVIALELLNTVVEAAVDIASPGFHPKAKVAKDVAAGAVLVSAIGAALVGAAIFIPRLVALLPR